MDYDSGIPWTPVIIVIIGLIAGMTLLAMCSSDRAAYRSQSVQAQTQAQIAAERERTERAIAEQETARRAAELRAENTARVTDYALLIILIVVGFVGLVGVGALAAIGLNWLDNRQLQRTLLLIETQRQAMLLLPEREQVYLLRIHQKHRGDNECLSAKEKTWM